jgi:hypothetical protein
MANPTPFFLTENPVAVKQCHTLEQQRACIAQNRLLTRRCTKGQQSTMRTLVLGMLLLSLPHLSCVMVDNVAARNRANLADLSLGMSRTEVLEAMGTAANASGESPTVIRNPHRVETLRGNDGIIYEVLFYCTGEGARGGAITNDELTPLILREGIFVGCGWSLLGKRLYRESDRPH